MSTTKVKRREFLQLAHKYDPTAKKVPDISGWFVSEKLDGTRCFWDGGLSRGLPTETVPWASVTDPKTGNRKGKIKPVATGLWSRYGNPIMAPDWFLNSLPCIPLDGELWAGRGNFQTCRSICAGDAPDDRFDQIQFAVYSSPPLEAVFGDGVIKNTNFHATIQFDAIRTWVQQRMQTVENFQALPGGLSFARELEFLSDALETQMSNVYLHQQVRLPDVVGEAQWEVEKQLEAALDRGGEGIILRSAEALWLPKRVRSILKYKPFSDAEGKVVGYTSGRQTDKGSKLLGMIGSLILDYEGKRLELAGLTNDERQFATIEYSTYAAANPGVDMPAHFQGKHFKLGAVVSFKYRELSDDGIPKEARYWRKPSL
ncbi:MAG: hypothetical protein ACYSW8_29430 [Planctomycetota bacterium]|jgi:DNA ligase-1